MLKKFLLLILVLSCIYFSCGDSDKVTGIDDSVAPAAVFDLAILDSTASSITLYWTAPGDDSTEGIASKYDIRYSLSGITGRSWEYASRAVGIPKPSEAGEVETFKIVNFLPENTYYFAIRTIDDAQNISLLSNISVGRTYSGHFTLYNTNAYSTGLKPISIQSADFNSDGFADLAVANSHSGTVSILLSDEEDIFGETSVYNAGCSPISLCSVDIDGDGFVDLAIANEFMSSISILLNYGDGTFRYAVNYATKDSPSSIISVDLDTDLDTLNLPDIVLTNSSSNSISILLNNGDSTFQTAVNYGVGNDPRSACLGDFDGDGDSDLAIANYGSNDVSILMNNGDGTFQPAVNYNTGIEPVSICSVDLNADGSYDLAVANRGSSNVSILLNNGNGTFKSAMNKDVGEFPHSIYPADFDNDGIFDLVVANTISGYVSILLNAGDGTFLETGKIVGEVGFGPSSVCSADFDNDGDFDIAVTRTDVNGVSLLLNEIID